MRTLPWRGSNGIRTGDAALDITFAAVAFLGVISLATIMSLPAAVAFTTPLA